MKLLLKLILREAWYHRSRISLAVIAAAAMSCMIVWLIGSIDLMMLRFDRDGEHYLGNFHAAMISQRERNAASSGGGTAAPALGTPPAPLFVEQKVIDALKKNDLVMQVSGAVQIRNTMAKYTDEESVLRRQRAGTGTPMGSPTIIGIDAAELPFELEDGKWFDANAEEMQGVIGTGAADSLGIWGGEQDPVKTGDSIAVRIEQREFKIKITGTVEQKLGGGSGMPGAGITPAVGAVYVSMKTAEKLQGSTAEDKNPLPFQYLYVRLRDGANVKQFKETWEQYLASENVMMKFIDADDIQESLNNQRGRGNAGGLVSGAASLNSVILFTSLVSILIVFTALSMGISERTRVFAMLRTVGMSRRQIAALVFGESIILCLLGWGCGIAAGWFMLQLSVWLQPGAFGSASISARAGGVSPPIWSISPPITLPTTAVITAGIAALIGSLLAAVIPALRGASIQPLEGMNRGYGVSVRKIWFVLCAVIGALLLTLNPVIVYYEALAKGGELRQFLYTYAGLPSQIAGFALIAPAAVLLVEKLFAPPAAWLLRVRKELLANQLSSNLWRTLGTTIALSIGLGVYSFLEIAGYSMLVPFTHSEKLPDTLAAFLPKGLPFEDIDKVRNLTGVDAKRFLPIALEQPLFEQGQAQQFQANGMSPMQANAGIVVFGLNIAEAFDKRENGKPFVDVRFTEGTPDEALQKLKTGGRYCIVPDSFAFRAGLHIGDKVKLLPPSPNGMRPGMGRGRGGFGGGRPPMPDGQGQGAGQDRPAGSPPMTGMGGGTGMGRGGFGGTPQMQAQAVEYEIAGVVSIPGWLWMAKLSGIRKYGYRSGAMLLAPYETVKNDFQLKDAAYFWFDRTLDTNGKPVVSDADLELALQKLADAQAGQVNAANIERPMVKVSSHDYLNDRVNSRADHVIQAAAKMPFILLAVSSLGMMGTIAASIRTRRFELGVLRSLGVTRFGLVRLILAEALLISLTAVVISLGFGVTGAWCFIGLMKYVSFFGGFTSPLTIPVYYLSAGLIVTITMCLLAAMFPAITAGRTEPAALLQER
ncbi:MAG: ABC transporter permease [Planctomycetaceae bacterium]|jgi:putative ABC transport system permease protein|nr:ABC transporter permease [Planctomycetaceae bacterium]